MAPARESIELSFIVALQHLPPRQRASVVLGDVLGFRTGEVAEMLDSAITWFADTGVLRHFGLPRTLPSL